MTVLLYFIVIQWSQKTGPADQTRPRIAKKHIKVPSKKRRSPEAHPHDDTTPRCPSHGTGEGVVPEGGHPLVRLFLSLEAQMKGLNAVESTLCAELWNEENDHAEQREAWEEERSVGCALCHPLIK